MNKFFSPKEFFSSYKNILLLVIVLVVLLNNSSNSFLIGWDNFLPEFDFLLNLKRSIFSVWQENQGLGLLDGMGHAAGFTHIILTWFISLFLPSINTVRQVYVFALLGTGAFGAYFLIKRLIGYKEKYLNTFVPTLGALFYLLNLATLQTFYVPFEPFVTHYAFLPWLFLAALNFIALRSKKSFLLFILINFLAVPQSQVPTIFVVYLFSLSFFLLVLILETKRREIFTSSIKVLLLTFAVNAFWLLPFIYFYLTNGSVAFEAKINQMSTETVFQQNKEFGNIWDVMLLKGFWFQNVDPNIKGDFTYMLAPWREHLTPFVSVIGYLLFAIVLTGFIYVKRKAPFVLPFSALFLLAFTMLATTTPPFSWIDTGLREIPVFNQIFRFPFTKFSILAALTYSFFFAIGIGKLIVLTQKINYKASKTLPIVFIVLMVIFMFPIFKGELFYSKEKIVIPKEYFQTFNFFKSQAPNARIANFPQHTFWGWTFYNWGYGGSGFLWYGIKQPILDRTFDVWSRFDENYYWELSYALYSKNPRLFQDILNKYQINFLLVDKNVINPSSPRALFTAETEDLVSKLNSVHKIATFGKIDIYEHKLRENINNFVFLTHKNPSINSYKWNNFDYAYTQGPNYVSREKNPDISYPFRSLFSGKNEEDKEFSLTENEDYLQFGNTLFLKEDSKIHSFLSFPPEENTIAVSFILDRQRNGDSVIKAKLESPQVFLDGTKVWGKTFEKALFLIPKGGPREANLSFGSLNVKVNLEENKKILGSTLISGFGQSIVSLSTPALFEADLANEIYRLTQQPASIEIKKGKNELRIDIPKVSDKNLSLINTPSKINRVKNCENFRKGKVSSEISDSLLTLKSKNSTACLSIYAASIPHNQAYAVFAQNQNISGRPIHFWVLNEDQKTSVLDTYLPKNEELSNTSFVIPPYEAFGLGYSLNFENISISDEVQNRLGKVSVYPIPFEFLTSVVINDKYSTETPQGGPILKVDHPNESLYIVDKVYEPDSMLVLSQSYDPGWKAYEVKDKGFLNSTFPFFFGNELKDHVLVNNWANGWVFDKTIEQFSNGTIVVLFLPQYLEYIGFLLLLLIPIYLLRLK